MVHSRKLLVEGDTDKRVIPYLMEANGIAWGPRNNPVVFIQPHGGMDELLKRDVIENELKVEKLEALGVLFKERISGRRLVGKRDENATNTTAIANKATNALVPRYGRFRTRSTVVQAKYIKAERVVESANEEASSPRPSILGPSSKRPRMCQ